MFLVMSFMKILRAITDQEAIPVKGDCMNNEFGVPSFHYLGALFFHGVSPRSVNANLC